MSQPIPHNGLRFLTRSNVAYSAEAHANGRISYTVWTVALRGRYQRLLDTLVEQTGKMTTTIVAMNKRIDLVDEMASKRLDVLADETPTGHDYDAILCRVALRGC